jgi:hypothetical protein
MGLGQVRGVARCGHLWCCTIRHISYRLGLVRKEARKAAGKGVGWALGFSGVGRAKKVDALESVPVYCGSMKSSSGQGLGSESVSTTSGKWPALAAT